jgi:DNA-binding MarR family transcriptional regulator
MPFRQASGLPPVRGQLVDASSVVAKTGDTALSGLYVRYAGFDLFNGKKEVVMPETLREASPTIQEDLQQRKPFQSASHEGYLSLIRTSGDSQRRIVVVLEAYDVTPQQYNVLRILRGAGEEGLPTLGVAERMIERTPGITRLIERMVHRKWVTRERCTDDRRRIWCRITESGLELLLVLDEPVSRAISLVGEALEPYEMYTLIGYLDRVRARMNATDD